jgi:ADP-heptose:LPS heptosyltransferase
LLSAQRNNTRLKLLRLAGRGLSRPATHTPRGERVLLIRPDHIGDVLLGAPAIALLRASWPGAYLSYLVGPWSAAAARCGPHVDEVRTLAFPGFSRRRNANLVAPYALLVGQAMRLRRQHYDLAVILRADHWWGALLALVAGIPVRVGSQTPETAALLTHARPPRPGEHAAELAFGVAELALRAVGPTAQPTDPAVSFTIGSAARPHALPSFTIFDAAQQPGMDSFTIGDAAHAAAGGLLRNAHGQLVALHPSAGAPLKSWPTHNWAALADRLAERGLAVILVGAPDDGPLLARVQAEMSRPPAQVAFGQSLDVSAAIYARCALVVGLDSGATHLAAAVGTPTVRLFGPASVEAYGPWPPRRDQQSLVAENLACVPCGCLESPPCGALSLPACLLALRVEDVLAAVERQLDDSQSG